MSLVLYGTPRSHFTRIVRILGHELGLEYQWIDVGNIGTAEAFGGNPLMAVPVLADGDRTIWNSHDICRYLVEREQADPLGVETLDWMGRRFLTVIHGVMNAEVRLILAERSGLETRGVVVFDKTRETIRQGLGWLDANVETYRGLTYPAVCVTAMWDHLLFYDNASRVDAPAICSVVDALQERKSVIDTRPI